MGGDMSAVEQAAMNVVMDYERRHWRKPFDVSKTGVGYDVRSEGPGGRVRYIEVKGHTTTGDVTLYYTEWQTANRMRDEFFIYVVDHALSAPNLLIVQDPVGKGVEPTESVVEYSIRGEQLRAHGLRVISREPDVEGRIREMVDRIVTGFQPLRILLFGSRARGDATPDSDVDLLVVMPDGTDRRATAVAILRTLTGMLVAKDVVVTTPEEIARRGALVGTVLRPALREGKVLYEQP
jgi:predicted nucleotidyltransferase